MGEGERQCSFWRLFPACSTEMMRRKNSTFVKYVDAVENVFPLLCVTSDGVTEKLASNWTSSIAETL